MHLEVWLADGSVHGRLRHWILSSWLVSADERADNIFGYSLDAVDPFTGAYFGSPIRAKGLRSWLVPHARLRARMALSQKVKPDSRAVFGPS